MKISTTLSAAALLAFVGAGANAQEWVSYVETGLATSARVNSEDDINGDPFFGGYLAASASTTRGDLRFSIDGHFEFIDVKQNSSYDESGPAGLGVVGVHLGKVMGNDYVGGYFGLGVFGVGTEEYETGFTIGVEGERKLANGLSIFGQLGYVDAVGDKGGDEFVGPHIRVGTSGEVTEAISFQLAAEYAYSPNCYADCGEWGRYSSLSMEVSYDLSDRMEMVGRARHALMTADTDEDASETTFYVGLRIPLGKANNNNLTTPIGGFQAAGWAEALD